MRKPGDVRAWVRNNAVTVMFVLLCIICIIYSGQSMSYVIYEMFGRLSRNAFIVLALMTIPGIVACVVCSIFFPALATVAGLLGMSVVNGGISVLVLWLCRNLLQYAELNNR